MRLVILFFCFVSCGLLSAQSEIYSRARVSLENRSLGEIAALGIETDHGRYHPGLYFEHDFSATEIERLRQAGFQLQIQIADCKAHYLELLEQGPPADQRSETCSPHISYPTPTHYTAGTMGGYFRYEEMLGQLDLMAALYSNIVKAKSPISNTLTTIEGRPIYYIKVSDSPTLDENEPEVLYTAVHHAREPNSLSQMIYFLWFLLENYETDPEIQYLVDHTELYFIPCMNPDGYLYNELTDPEGGGYWRKNRRDNGDGTFGVDLNRNYGYLWGYNNQGSSDNPDSQVYRGTAPFSEPETQMIRDFCNEHAFQICLNYHTFSNLLIHPWGYEPIDTEDEATFANISHIAGADNFYLYGNSSILYTVNGSSDDWMYGEQGTKPKILSFTPEVGSPEYGFWPPSWMIERYNRENILQNLTAARVVHNFAIATDLNPCMLEDKNGYFAFQLKKYGLADGNLTVTLTGDGTHIVSTGPPAIISIGTNEVWTEAISYTLAPDIAYGQELRFVLSVDNGLHTYSDTIIKYFGVNYMAVDNPVNSADGWQITDGFWSLSSNNPHSGPSAYTSVCCNGYSEINTAAPVDLTPYTEGNAYLTYWVRWDIDRDLDYAQVSLSSDGNSYEPVCGMYTVAGGQEQLPDEPIYAGYQPVWVQEKIDISDYLGSPLYIRFSYKGEETNGPFSAFAFDDMAVCVLGEEPLVGVFTVKGDDFILSEAMPNPASDAVRITARGEFLQIFDLMGRLRREIALDSANAQQIRLDISGLENGTYSYRVVAAGRISPARLLLVHH